MEELDLGENNLDTEFLSALLLADKKQFLDGLQKIDVKLLDGLEQKVYIYIREHYRKYKEQPNKLVVIQKYPKLKFHNVKATLQYYIDELYIRSDYSIMTENSSEIQQCLMNQDIDTAKSLFRKTIEAIETVRMFATYTLGGKLTERLKKYIEHKESGGIIGLQTGIKKIDDHIGGIQDEMFVILGRSGLGKTFFMLLIAKAFAFQLKKPIAIVSNEMSTTKLGFRLDSDFAEVSYSRYRKGLCTTEEEKKLVKLRKIYKNDICKIHLISGVGKSAEQIGYELAVLDIGAFFVDGMYLQNQGFSDPFNNTLSASRTYREIVKQLNCPGIFTSQSTKEDEAKYARAIQEDADMVLLMRQPPVLKDEKVMNFLFTKIREEEGDLQFWLNWVFDNWDFSERNYDEADTEMEQTFE